MASSSSTDGETPLAQKTFKEQLDQAADETRANDKPPEKPNPIVEKITEYIPAAASILGGDKSPPKEVKHDIPGPPNRPDHDYKIEDFVRDQHRSDGVDGLLGGDKE